MCFALKCSDARISLPRRRADDHLAVRRRAEHLERQRPRVRVVARERRPGCRRTGASPSRTCRRAAAAPTSPGTNSTSTRNTGPHSEKAATSGPVLVSSVRTSGSVTHARDDEQQHRADRDADTHQHAGPARQREQPDDREDQGREHDHVGRAEAGDERDRGEAAEAGADEVGEVQAADAVGRPAEDRRHDDPDRDERREDREADDRDDRRGS